MTRTVKCGLMGLRITPPPERRVSRRARRRGVMHPAHGGTLLNKILRYRVSSVQRLRYASADQRIRLCAAHRASWPQSGEPWRLHTCPQWSIETVLSTAPSTQRSSPPLAPARLLAIVPVQLVEGRTGLVALSRARAFARALGGQDALSAASPRSRRHLRRRRRPLRPHE